MSKRVYNVPKTSGKVVDWPTFTLLIFFIESYLIDRFLCKAFTKFLLNLNLARAFSWSLTESEKRNLCSSTARWAVAPSRASLQDKLLFADLCEKFDRRDPCDEFDFLSSLESKYSRRCNGLERILSHETCRSCCLMVIVLMSAASARVSLSSYWIFSLARAGSEKRNGSLNSGTKQSVFAARIALCRSLWEVRPTRSAKFDFVLSLESK